MKQRWLYFVLLLIVISGAGYLALQYSLKTKNLANSFINHLEKDHYSQILHLITPELQEQLPPRLFKDFLTLPSAKMIFPVAEEINWFKEETKDNKKRLKGIGVSEDGYPVMIEMSLKRSEKQWKVDYLSYYLNKPGAQSRRTPPTLSERQQLVSATTKRFGEAVRNRNLAAFYQTTADAFQQQFSVTTFQQAFQGFVNQQTNFMALQGLAAVFSSQSSFRQYNQLLLEGYYDTRPSKIHFRYEYYWDAAGWHLSGIQIEVKPII